jgi:hypothetical protein
MHICRLVVLSRIRLCSTLAYLPVDDGCSYASAHRLAVAAPRPAATTARSEWVHTVCESELGALRSIPFPSPPVASPSRPPESKFLKQQQYQSLSLSPCLPPSLSSSALLTAALLLPRHARAELTPTQSLAVDSFAAAGRRTRTLAQWMEDGQGPLAGR